MSQISYTKVKLRRSSPRTQSSNDNHFVSAGRLDARSIYLMLGEHTIVVVVVRGLVTVVVMLITCCDDRLRQ